MSGAIIDWMNNSPLQGVHSQKTSRSADKPSLIQTLTTTCKNHVLHLTGKICFGDLLEVRHLKDMHFSKVQVSVLRAQGKDKGYRCNGGQGAVREMPRAAGLLLCPVLPITSSLLQKGEEDRSTITKRQTEQSN